MCIFPSIPGPSVYLIATCPFLGRSSAALNSRCIRTPQNSNGRPSRICHQPSIATPTLEGPLTNDQVNHIIERYHPQQWWSKPETEEQEEQLVKCSSWGSSPATAQCLRDIGTGVGYMHNGGGGYGSGHDGMYLPPRPRGGEFGRGDG